MLATHWALYRATAKEGFDMVEHISKLRGLQNQLHAIENSVTDEDSLSHHFQSPGTIIQDHS